MKRRHILTILVCLALSSCDKYDFPGMISGSSPASNERFAVSKAYNDANGFTQFTLDRDDYTFYAASDAHISTTSDALSRFVSEYIDDVSAAPFALFMGDAMDKKNNFNLFLETVSPIRKCGRTLFCTPGNHDLYFGQWDDFIRETKTATYCFIVSNDLFICLDSASGTLGTDQRAWLESILKSAGGHYRHIIVFTHTHFFKRDNSQGHTSNFNLEEGYDLMDLFSDNGVDLVISGHDHFFEDTWFKGVHYITVAAIEDAAEEQYYFSFMVTEEDIRVCSHKIQ